MLTAFFIPSTPRRMGKGSIMLRANSPICARKAGSRTAQLKRPRRVQHSIHQLTTVRGICWKSRTTTLEDFKEDRHALSITTSREQPSIALQEGTQGKECLLPPRLFSVITQRQHHDQNIDRQEPIKHMAKAKCQQQIISSPEPWTCSISDMSGSTILVAQFCMTL